MPSLVATFHEQHPSVRPLVTISDTAAVVAALQQGEAEVGFVGARLPGRGLHHEVVAADEVVLVVPATHRFAGRHTVALAELGGESLVARAEGSGTMVSLRRLLGARGLRLPHLPVVMELSTTQAIISAVACGHGVGWVSTLALAGRGDAAVVPVRLKELTLRRSLYMVTSQAVADVPVAAAFVAWVRRSRYEDIAGEAATR